MLGRFLRSRFVLVSTMVVAMSVAQILILEALGGLEQFIIRIDAQSTDTELPAATAAADDMANPTAPFVLGAGMLYDGTTWDRARGNATDGALVNLGANNDVVTTSDDQQADDNSIAYSLTIPAVANLNYCDNGSNWVRCAVSTGGSGAVDANTTRVVVATDDDVSDAATLFEANLVAHDAADAGSPLKVGFKAIAHGTNPTAVAAADRTDWYANRAGVPFVMAGHPNVVTAEAQVQDADGAQTDAALVTCGTGCKVVVTQVMAACDNATTNGTNIVLGFGTSTIPSRAHTGVAGIVAAFDNVPPGGGFTRGAASGILGVGADGEDLRLTMEDPVGGNCSVTYSYYTIES